jgi:hypothetical protein
MLAEALLAPDLDADDAEYLESEAVEQILDPWQEGHDGYRADLYAALAEINPSLPEFLKGACADIHTDGPAALIKVATCLTETLDWFLRSLVPLDTLPGWLAGQGLNGRTYLENGRPTRAAKIAYILRTRSRRDVTVIRTLERTLTRRLNDLRSDIEAMKHGGTIARVGDTAVRLHAHSVENLLGQFLFDL